MISQANVSASTPMGATLVAGGGATFRTWAPRATAVYVNGTFGGAALTGQSSDLLMAKDANGYWTGYIATAQEGDLYRFWVIGPGSSGYKRDPYARDLATDAAFPNCSCIIRAAAAYPWHDAAYVTPDFTNMIVYQAHLGTYAITKPGIASTFLDLIGKIPYLVALGINILQPLPVDEVETDPSMGYDGADYFSPDFPYVVTDPTALAQYLATINGLLAAKGCTPLALADISSGHGQLKAMVDLCHVYGIGVVFDVVYNHAGGFSVNGLPDDECIYYYDRVPNVGNNNDSLYFTDQDRGTGGLSFALWNNDVRQFIINSACNYIGELHADGFRYDEISDLISMNGDSGWSFCCDLTNTVRFVKPNLLQNAEFWPGEVGNYPKSSQSIVTPVADGGAGFDVLQHDGLRTAVRAAITAASYGQQAAINFDAIAGALYPSGFVHAWQTVPCIENHDIVKVGTDQRIPFLADSADTRSWYARSRTRLAMGILLTAPGIPQLFMGQEFLEDQQWSWDPTSSNLLDWSGLTTGSDQAMVDHLRFTQDLIQLRWRQAALRGDNVNPFYVHDANRVLAFHRWLDGVGADVVVVATLAEDTWYNYSIGFPGSGDWAEVFNSDVYDNFVNPIVAGNGGGITASGPPMHGFSASASIVIPANGFVVFARG
ncbi:MAG TPA: alpha amylase C-terminal domain-containing protein [Bryobacteraceae bacterium]|nr:alpha amylase C-terminal domain-containing protein [Bryobacteraceae bacterium]